MLLENLTKSYADCPLISESINLYSLTVLKTRKRVAGHALSKYVSGKIQLSSWHFGPEDIVEKYI